jgi:hypothetical protein
MGKDEWTVYHIQKRTGSVSPGCRDHGDEKTDAFDGEIVWSIEADKAFIRTGKDAEDGKSNAQGYAAILHPEKPALPMF